MPQTQQEDVAVPSRRALVTGATGLLGRAVYQEFKDNEWNVLGCGYSRARPRFEMLNLLDAKAIQETVQDFQPHVIVHCAAERRIDVAENQPDVASELNVVASGNLAKEAAQVGAFLIYISSDYVFDGTNPPYAEEDVPNPLNIYGRTKLDGEKAVLQNSEGAAVLRIPMLYGEVERLDENPLTVLFESVQQSHKSANMDHVQTRFPTHVKDVATVCRQLSERKMTDPSLKGIFHWSGNEQMTKYEIACAMADVFNLSHNHLIPVIKSDFQASSVECRKLTPCTRKNQMVLEKLKGQPTPILTAILELILVLFRIFDLYGDRCTNTLHPSSAKCQA